MSNGKDMAAREALQGRVAKVVWGLLLIGMGAFLTLDNHGKIDLAPHSPHPASNAVDGNPRTRWSSAFSDPQWLTVDLGGVAAITRVRLNWETAYGRDYAIETSPDGTSWTTLVTVKDGDGGVEEHEASAIARYVRMYGMRRATPYGYSLWEMEVYGSASPMALPASAMDTSSALLSLGKPAEASSRERTNLWVIYWPLLLIAGGIPAILVPKDSGDQVLGLVITSAGVFVQARTFGLTSWGWGEALPVLLILAGAVLVLQSLRRPNGDAPAPGGPAGSTASAS